MRKWIINKLLRHLLNPVMVEDVLTLDKVGRVYFNNKLATKNELKALNAEAKFISKSRAWQILTATPESQAHKKMFQNSTNFEDMFFGKAMLFNIDLQRNILAKLETLHSKETVV